MANVEKKRKWERDYESYANSTELDERIEYLTDLTNGNVAMKEEYQELKRLNAIKANLPKVKNILELREQLETQRKEINEEIKLREQIEKKEKENEDLEAKMAKEFDNINKQNEKLVELLKSGKLSEKQKEVAKIKIKENEDKLKGNVSKRQENNKIFGDNLEEIGKLKKQLEEKGKFNGISTEDLRNQVTQTSSNISKCNLACNKLMQGYSWQSVEVALDKFDEKFTAKGENAAKIKENREAAKAANSKTEQLKMNFGPAAKVEPVKNNTVEEKTIIKPNSEKTKQEPKREETALKIPTRWQKIKGWAKNWFERMFVEEVEEDKEQVEVPEKKSIFARIKEAFMKKEEADKQEENKHEEKTEEVAKQEEAKKEGPVKTESKSDIFRQYLRDVAENGIDGVEQEKAEAEKAAKAARMQAAKEKLKANRAGKDTGAIITNLDKELNGQNDDAR